MAKVKRETGMKLTEESTLVIMDLKEKIIEWWNYNASNRYFNTFNYPQRNKREENNKTCIKEEIDNMRDAIRYIKFSRYYDKFDERKEKANEISKHKVILNYITKKWNIPI